MKKDKNQRIRNMVEFIGDKIKVKHDISEIACTRVDMVKEDNAIYEVACTTSSKIAASSEKYLSKEVSLTQKAYHAKVINTRDYLSQNDIKILERKLKI